MQEKLTGRKSVRAFILLCCVMYFSSYITRHNFSAIISAIVEGEHYSKSALSTVVTAGFISYGVGQLISGEIGNRTDPVRMIFYGLLCTSLMNLMLPLSGSITAMTVIWLVNGLAQAMLWPPVMRLCAHCLNQADYRSASVKIPISGICATVVLYLVSPFIIRMGNWRTTFYISAVVGLAASALWRIGMAPYIGIGKASNDMTMHHVQKLPVKGLTDRSGLGLIITGILMMGILRGGVETWAPSYIMETFHVNASSAILVSVMLPVFSIIAALTAAKLQKNLFTNELLCSSALFMLAVVAGLILFYTYQRQPWSFALLSAIITGCMQAVNIMLVCMVPCFFSRYNAVSRITGFLNFFAYVGSAISAYGFVALSDRIGQQNTILCWTGISILGAVACLLNIKRWDVFSLPERS